MFDIQWNTDVVKSIEILSILQMPFTDLIFVVRLFLNVCAPDSSHDHPN